MVDDALFGSRNRRGDWAPFQRIEYPPVFVWPARPGGILKWLAGVPGYLLPWNALYALVAVLFWLYLTPPLETLRSLAPGWIAFLLVRNALLTFAFFGVWHLRLYVRRAQGSSFKFNNRWLATDSSVFLFRDQTLDNMVWTFASGVPIWTAYEAVTLWAFANGYIPYVSFAAHPLYCTLLLLLIPLWRELHFYLVHRALHWGPLYRLAHKLHHHNANPGPWSGLAMHPVEHLLYFSAVLLHWIVPSHPAHAVYNLVHLAMAPAPGHAGFDKVVVGDGRTIDVPCHAHYLHHKYFECNYADGTVPFDKWFGTFHDGSDAAHEAMRARMIARRRGA